jgi:hypothetical protein
LNNIANPFGDSDSNILDSDFCLLPIPPSLPIPYNQKNNIQHNVKAEKDGNERGQVENQHREFEPGYPFNDIDQ